MKKIYHVCYTSHREVMFRSREDYNHAFNSLASALVKNEAKLLAEAFMSDHVHAIILAEDPKCLVHDQRCSHVKYMNHKYHRVGPWGEPGFFQQEIDGIRHLQTALVYVICNPVHHGVVPMPYMYPFSSANCYFRKELGKILSVPEGTRAVRKTLPRRLVMLPGWQVGQDGGILRETVVEAKWMEATFVSPQAFLYLINRKSSDEWRKEQELDECGRPPITLESMEAPYLALQDHSAERVANMLKREKGHFSPLRKTDLELCELIDNHYVKKFRRASVYELSRQEKATIANELLSRFHCGETQLRRCLVF